MCRIVPLAARFAESREWVVLGSSSAAHWVAEVADIEVCTAREWVRVGRRLQGLPRTAEAFADERVSYSKVRTLTRVATSETEDELLVLAEATPAGHLARAIAAWASEKSDDEELARLQHKGRSLTWRHEPDGLVTFTMRLVPEIAGRLIAEVSTRVMRTTAKEAGQLAWPSLAHQQADAFASLVAEGGGDTEVVLHVRSDGTSLDDGTPILGSVVERLAPQSFMRALIHDADGRPINASARRRPPTTRQKRVVKARDQRCVDCGSEVLLEYDHNPDFAISGQTVVEELELRCSPCHQKRHRFDAKEAA